jgi:hypothetical protein
MTVDKFSELLAKRAMRIFHENGYEVIITSDENGLDMNVSAAVTDQMIDKVLEKAAEEIASEYHSE